MLFNSIEFAFFFPIVTALFFLLPHRFRWGLLLLASCFFYMFFKPVYILILVFTIVIDYFAGIWISNQKDKRKKKYLLLLSIVANLSVLIIFKYYNFIIENLNLVSKALHENGNIPILNIILPIGLSFHTFQAMSYTIEVYRGKQKVERHFGIYALYVMFYPQLVAGPIERPQNMLHQFHEKKVFNYENFRSGLILMAWGFFKKVVIADRLAAFVNQVYGNPTEYTGIPLIIATVFFSFQIFCDFSGYSDIALGSARCMGFNLMINFDRPYMAKSISEFWRRWHISLSTWFKDYVYIPLGGNRVSKARWYLNLLIVFLLSGIWHGANWTFVVWGLLHGIYLITESQFSTRFKGSMQLAGPKMPSIFKSLVVFIFVSLAWIFFRAQNVEQALFIVQNLFTDIMSQFQLVFSDASIWRSKLVYLHQPASEFFIAVLSICLLILIHRTQKDLSFDQWLIRKKRTVRWAFYFGLVIFFVSLGVFNRSTFIYFQF